MAADDRTAGSREKTDLRRHLKTLRAAVPVEERHDSSLRIAEKLLALVAWSEIHAMHIYRAVPAWSEVETEPIVLGVRKTHPAIEIVSPGSTSGEPMPERPFDLIVVPVLGFDRSNYRLGLGAGFYDRFLARQPQARKIGLAYSWALLPDDLPREPHDIPLDEIVTDA